MDGSGLRAAGTPGAEQAAMGAKGTTALDRFSQDLTAKAQSGDDGPDRSAATTKSARSSTC